MHRGLRGKAGLASQWAIALSRRAEASFHHGPGLQQYQRMCLATYAGHQKNLDVVMLMVRYVAGMRQRCHCQAVLANDSLIVFSLKLPHYC